MYEGDDTNFDAAPPEESSNRTFLYAAGILGGIVLVSIACLAAYALIFLPGQRQQQQEAANVQATQNAQIAGALTATFQAQIQPTATLPPTNTPVVAQPSATATQPSSTPDPSTATVAAALTQAAQAQQTVVVTSTALPGTGIADEYGAPGLVVMTLALVAVIFLARRMRAVPSR